MDQGLRIRACMPAHLGKRLPTCLRDGQTPGYAPVTVAGHLKEMFRGTYAWASLT